MSHDLIAIRHLIGQPANPAEEPQKRKLSPILSHRLTQYLISKQDDILPDIFILVLTFCNLQQKYLSRFASVYRHLRKTIEPTTPPYFSDHLELFYKMGDALPYTCNACLVAFRTSDAQREHMRRDWQYVHPIDVAAQLITNTCSIVCTMSSDASPLYPRYPKKSSQKKS